MTPEVAGVVPGEGFSVNAIVRGGHPVTSNLRISRPPTGKWKHASRIDAVVSRETPAGLDILTYEGKPQPASRLVDPPHLRLPEDVKIEAYVYIDAGAERITQADIRRPRDREVEERLAALDRLAQKWDGEDATIRECD